MIIIGMKDKMIIKKNINFEEKIDRCCEKEIDIEVRVRLNRRSSYDYIHNEIYIITDREIDFNFKIMQEYSKVSYSLSEIPNNFFDKIAVESEKRMPFTRCRCLCEDPKFLSFTSERIIESCMYELNNLRTEDETILYDCS